MSTASVDNGPPPPEAACLYSGTVMHARLRPFGHRFTYSVFNLLIDVTGIEAAGRMSPLFSVNRFNVLSFHERDHAPCPDQPLAAHLGALLDAAGLAERPARILLLCYPRVLGFVFNPISVYFALSTDDRLLAAVYEVRNTFGQRHTYVARVEPGELTEAGLRQSRTKRFHVSPFIGMDARYHFRLLPPGRQVRLRILETEGDAPVLSAAFSGQARPLSTRSILREVVRVPLLTLKVVAGIHYEALKLWLKGALYHPVPAAPEPFSWSETGRLPTAGRPHYDGGGRSPEPAASSREEGR